MTIRSFLKYLLPAIIGVYIVYHFEGHVQLLAATHSVLHPRQLPPYIQSLLLRTKTPPSPSNQTSRVRTPFTRHVVAVGDLHGDFPNARKVLQFSGVIDEFEDWSGNTDFFVQTGDIIDRGPDTIKLYAFMEKLRVQAPSKGGFVLSCLGNHEWMNALGDWRYVYPSDLETFPSVAARQEMLSTGAIGRAWATNYTTAARLPLHPSIGGPNTPFPPQQSLHIEKDDGESSHNLGPLSHSALSFVHGGLSPTYSNLAPFPSRINIVASALLHKLQSREQPPPHPPNPYKGLPDDATPEEDELYASNGPLWYRGWATNPDEQVCADVDKVLEATGTRRMIMGHTPDFDNIVARCNAKIIIIDTGISRAYGGVLSALDIHYTLTPLPEMNEDGEDLWLEKEVVSAIYEDRREILVTEERQVAGHFS